MEATPALAVETEGAYGQQESTDALDAYRKGQQLIDELHSQGEGEGTKDGYDKAAKEFEKAIALDPNLVNAYLALAQTYWNKSLYPSSDRERAELQEQALALYQKVIAIDPSHAEVYYQLSFRIQNGSDRFFYLKKTVELDPQHPWAHGQLAEALVARGEVDEAFTQYLLHLEVSPYRGRQDGFNGIWFARSLTQAGRPQEAIKILERLLMLEPRAMQRCFVFAQVNLESYRAFPAFVEQVEQLLPYCTKLEHRNRAVALIHEGKTTEALQELHLQLKANRHYPETYRLLRDLYEADGQQDKAQAIIVRYLEVEKDEAEQCRAFKRLHSRYKRIDQQIMRKLRAEC